MLRRGRRTNLRWGVLERVYGLWTGTCVWTVRRHAARIQDATIFFQDRFVTEMDVGVRVHAWAQGLRWRACELATDS